MDAIKLNFEYALGINPQSLLEHYEQKILARNKDLQIIQKNHLGHYENIDDYELLPHVDEKEFEKIDKIAEAIKEYDALLIIGVGGSYLAIKALLQAMFPFFQDGLPIYFAGFHFCASYHHSLLEKLKDTNYCINLISKSGQTLESNTVFRLFCNSMQKQKVHATPWERRVFISTMQNSPLYQFADTNNIACLELKKNISGRYSFFSPVTFLPLAAKGLHYRELILGAEEMRAKLFTYNRSNNQNGKELQKDIALLYALYRHFMYTEQNMCIEITSSYDFMFEQFCFWQQQLFIESEGKNKQGLFVAPAFFSRDLHSLGQWMQEGPSIAFTTVLRTLKQQNFDNAKEFDKIEPKQLKDHYSHSPYAYNLNELNEKCLNSALSAHNEAKVSALLIEVQDPSLKNLGALGYFFLYAATLSATFLGLDPFNQPGVELYKKYLLASLGRTNPRSTNS